jgi:hypothetical protein
MFHNACFTPLHRETVSPWVVTSNEPTELSPCFQGILLVNKFKNRKFLKFIDK